MFKLLKISKEEPDIDLALDNMMGREFANKLQSYLKSRNIHCGHISVIQQNPEQSKHLETARVKVNGIYLDLVNLRKESYAQDSRIPHMEIGTPLEDAMRRDLTINSLFYNLNDDIIEDFSGKGLSDLKKGVIRTPLEPRMTLLDDPLRALRAIRFASRFDFEMDLELYNCCRSHEVHIALGEKVSRERIGTEIDYMLRTASYVRAFGILYETGLYKAVFNHAPVTDSSFSQEKAFYEALVLLSKLDWIRQGKTFRYSHYSEEDVIIEELAVLSVAFHRYEVYEEKEKVNLVQHILRHCLKRRNRDCDSVMTVLQSSNDFMAHLSSEVPSNDRIIGVDGEPVRLSIGRILRKSGSLWNMAFKVACCRMLKGELEWNTFSRGGQSYLFLQNREESDMFLQKCRDWESFIVQLGIEDVYKWKPLLNGTEVLSLLPKLPRGPKIRQVLDAQVEWMLMNPSGTREDCKKWLLEEYKSFSNPCP